MASSFDLVIKHGWTVDGTGNPWFRRNIRIRGGDITRPGHITVNSDETEVQSTPEGEIAQSLVLFSKSHWPFLISESQSIVLVLGEHITRD